MDLPLRIEADDLSRSDVQELIVRHTAELQHWSPPGTSYALPVERLRDPEVAFYTAWHGERLAGCGAIKQLDVSHGELKSMRVVHEYLRRGVGTAILLHLLEVARGRGYARVSLETGSTEPYVAARRLYERHGFTRCPAFAGYPDDGFSYCMTRWLSGP